MPMVLFLGMMLLFPSQEARGDLIDSGTFSGTSPNLGSYVAGTSTFTLTAAQISDIELTANFMLIDDGVEIVVNGTSLYLAVDLSQFGAQDFVVSAVQPNDIADPWTLNNSSLPRLTSVSNSSGTAMSGSTSIGATGVVSYLPAFSVEDFNSLLVAGTNTIDFVNHNGFQGAALTGNFSVTTSAVPEPSASLLGAVILIGLGVRRRRQNR